MFQLNLKTTLLFLCLSLVGAGFNSSSGCSAGGPGASSCSTSTTVGPVTTSIGISCAPGYYACCMLGGASCKGDNMY
jgi:hypothetical protein